MSNLILFGFKGCGKTYWGKRLAEALHYTFIDTDTILEELYAKQHHKKLTCPAIYQAIGEKEFRALEHAAIQTLKGKTQCVIALGGGAVLYHNNMTLLNQIGRLVYLKVDKHTLKERIFSQGIPAYFDPNHPEDSFEKIYRERMPLYERIPAYQVDLSGQSEQDMLKQLMESIDG